MHTDANRHVSFVGTTVAQKCDNREPQTAPTPSRSDRELQTTPL